nr:hypothetical protein [Tanacetum cinerariifolium]
RTDDEGADDQVKDGDDDEGDEGDESDEGEEDADEDKDGDERDDDEENQETAKYDEHDDAEGGGNDKEEGESDEEDDNEETKEEENFDPIPRTPKSSEDEEDQGLNVNEEEHVEDEEKNFIEILKSLEANFSEYRQTNPFAEAVSNILVVADLFEMELKKILFEKMEGNKSIQRSDEQRNLYKALVDAYEADMLILDSYGETVILKRRRDDDDDQDEGPSAGSDRGSKRRRKGAKDQPIVQNSMYPEWFSQLKNPLTLDRDWNKTLPAPLPLIPDNRGRCVIPFAHFINNDLEYLRGGTSSRKYTTSVTKTKAADYGNIKWIEDLVPRTIGIQEPIDYDKHAFWGVSHWGRIRQQFYGFTVNRESALDVYSKRRIIPVTYLKIVKWHSYKHLVWILESCPILPLRNVLPLTSLLGCSQEASSSSDVWKIFNWESKATRRGSTLDKKNRLIRIDELYKFNDGTLNDVRTALDDRLKGIRMQYLSQSIWRKGDKDRAVAMI